MTMSFDPGCGWEGPRGGGCDRHRTHVVEAGDPDGAFFSCYSCDEHIEDLRVEAFKVTNLIPRVITDAEFRARAEKRRLANETGRTV